MQAVAVGGQKTNAVTDYTLKVLMLINMQNLYYCCI